MPKFGMAQETGQVIRWFKQEGEPVQQGEALLEVMTDKLSMEVEAPASGILRGINAAPEDVVPVTEVIAYIAAPEEAWSAPSVPARAKAKAQPVSVEKAETGATPVAARLAAEHQADLTQIAGTGPGGRVKRQDVEAYLAAQGSSQHPALAGAAVGKPRATPAARRVARETGTSLEGMPGSGPRGRIQATDVEAFLARPVTSLAARARQEQIIPLKGVRKIIAERMTASAQTAPHISFTVHADVTRAEALRAEANRRLGRDEDDKVSLTAVFVRIVAWALTKHPWMNATLKEDGIHLLPQINVGLATAPESGLIVPVIRDADLKTVGQIATELNDLVRRARENQLTPDEVTGGTFTLSNLGMFGIETFTAILNPPETGILAIGAVVREPVVLEGDEVVVRPRVGLTLSADHRVVDGVSAAKFLSDVKAAIQEPDLLLL
jgi:pyruvate dehydrogenase E2 component (dihydrolipoamide acetyltransferase)